MKMFYKKDNALVEVYKIFIENGKPSALIFSPSAQGGNNNGWIKVNKISQLIPEEYYNPAATKGFMSKTQRNKIKKRLSLTSAIWTCSDGIKFSDIEDAIAHEKEIMEEENDANLA